MNVLTYMNVLPFGKLQMEILKCVIAQLSLACIAGSVGELWEFEVFVLLF